MINLPTYKYHTRKKHTKEKQIIYQIKETNKKIQKMKLFKRKFKKEIYDRKKAYKNKTKKFIY